jgi:hypothetical protein
MRSVNWFTLISLVTLISLAALTVISLFTSSLNDDTLFFSMLFTFGVVAITTAIMSLHFKDD